MAVNGIGRVMPLLFLTVLGILGINAIGDLTKRIEGIRKFTVWALVVLGVFILLNGVYGHLWYEGEVFHGGDLIIISLLLIFVNRSSNLIKQNLTGGG